MRMCTLLVFMLFWVGAVFSRKGSTIVMFLHLPAPLLHAVSNEKKH